MYKGLSLIQFEQFFAAITVKAKGKRKWIYIAPFCEHLTFSALRYEWHSFTYSSLINYVAGLYIIFLRTRVVSCRNFSHITDVSFRTYTFGCPLQLYSHYFHVSHFPPLHFGATLSRLAFSVAPTNVLLLCHTTNTKFLLATRATDKRLQQHCYRLNIARIRYKAALYKNGLIRRQARLMQRRPSW